MDGLINQGEWGYFALTGSKFSNGDTVFAPVVDGVFLVLALSLNKIVTMGGAHTSEVHVLFSIICINLPAVSFIFYVTGE